MDQKFDKEIETHALREAGNYLYTLLTGDTTILPDELPSEIAGLVPKNKRVRLCVITEYMLMRIVELGFAGLKKEVEMIHGSLDVDNPANAEAFRPDAYPK